MNEIWQNKTAKGPNIYYLMLSDVDGLIIRPFAYWHTRSYGDVLSKILFCSRQICVKNRNKVKNFYFLSFIGG